MNTTDPTPETVTTRPDSDRIPASDNKRPLWRIAFAVCAFAIIAIAASLLLPRHVEAAAPAPAASKVSQVSIRNVQFFPATLEVPKGAVVEWKNDDLIPHTATAPSFDSGSLASGKSWRHTFTEAGTFPYICTFHPTMKGVVVVK